ncbi:ATP-binding protein [Streptomyces daliensis]|uniref:ATP-binding protein n=1 Tax=Streptomyces daliensis TaxID=299421 RepID=A0A8T4IQ09_9ACTN|nr:ATP-binding protein [Streptomyces daliensis]
MTVCWAQGAFSREGQAVRAARDFAADVLARWGLPEGLRDEVRMCVSEAATNAVLHTTATAATTVFEVTLDLLRTESELRVHVGDGDPDRVPVATRPELEDTSGRGLLLIKSMAHDFTVTRTRRGKTVSFSFGIPQPRRIPGAAR